MNEMYSKDSFPLEWICKIISEMETFSEAQSFLLHPVSIYIERLLEINPNSSVGLLAKAVLLYKEENDLIAARDILLVVYEMEPTWNRCQTLLLDIYLQLRAYDSAEFIYRQMKKKENDLRVVKALIKVNQADKAIIMCKELLVDAQNLEEQMDILTWFAK